MIQLEINSDIEIEFVPSDIFSRWKEFNSRTHQIVYFPNSDLEWETYYDNFLKPAFSFIQGEFKCLIEVLSHMDSTVTNIYYTTIQDSQLHIPKDFRKQYLICHNEDFDLSILMDENCLDNHLPF